MSKKFGKPAKPKTPKLPLGQRGFRPYMGTVAVGDANIAKVNPEPSRNRSVLPDSIRGVITHEVMGCGAHTEVWVSNIEIGLPFTYTCSGCKQLVSADRILKRDLPSQNYVMFGDESSYKELSTYGLVLFHEKDLDNAEKAIRELLNLRSGTEGARLHCRELFDGRAREKSVWKDLNEDGVFKLLQDVLKVLNDFGATYFLGIADRSTWPESLQGKNEPFIVSKEHMYLLAFEAAVKPLEARGFLKKEVNLRVFLDPQKNKIELAGGGRTMVETIFKGRLKAEDITQSKPLLLDIADVFAYIGSHAFKEQNDPHHKIFGGMLAFCAPAAGFARWVPQNSKRGFELEEVEGVLVMPDAENPVRQSQNNMEFDLTVPSLPPARGWSVVSID